MTETEELLTLLAQKGLRGRTITSLVLDAQETEQQILDVQACPNILRDSDSLHSDVEGVKLATRQNLKEGREMAVVVDLRSPSQAEVDERAESYLFLLRERIKAINNEIARRETLTFQGIHKVNEHVIQAIKESLGEQGLIDVLAWYVKVFFERGKWTFQCTLHGADKDPSGVIYPRELRWWCFGCGAGGDAFDAVQAFERVDLITAIKKLARYTGIELKEARATEKTEVKQFRGFQL